MYIRYALFAPLSFAMNILTYILSPFLALLSMFTGPKPGFLSWFYTHDDDLDGGQHQLGWPKAKGVPLMVQRMKWLCRNPGYGFDAYVLGFSGLKVLSQTITGDWSNGGTGSRLNHTVMQGDNGKKYFMYYREVAWSSKRYMKIFLGWKIWDNGTNQHMLALDFHPYKSRN